MLSGVGPEKHKIIWNEINLELGIIEVPTLFSLAHEAGLSTAMVVGKPKFEHLVIPGSVDDYIYAGFTDSQVVKEAVQVIEAGLPDLLFIHLPDVDSAGHLSGWMSSDQLEAIALTDHQVGKVVSALEAGGELETSLLIITADHGGHERLHGSDLPEDMTIPWLAVGPGIPAGLTIAGEIISYDTAATALYALGVPVPPEWDGEPVLEIFNQLPESAPSRQEGK
jgi:phosphopentomutase